MKPTLNTYEEDYLYGDFGYASQKDYEESRDNGLDIANEKYLKEFYLGKSDYCNRCQGKCMEAKHE